MLYKTTLSLAVSALCFSVNVSAATWIAGVGEWSNPSFWDIGTIPPVGDNIAVNDPNLFQFIEVSPGVGFNGNASVNSVSIGANNGVLARDEIHITDARTFSVTGGGISNDGIISLNSAGNLTTLSFIGDQSVTGSGEIRLSNHANNRIITSGGTLTNGVGHRIVGAGVVLGGNGGLINLGIVEASEVLALIIDPNALGVSNSGVMTGTGSGGLTLINGTFTNFIGGDLGEINAASNSKVTIQNSTVNGGIVTTVGTGFIDLRSNSTFDGVSFQDNVTTNGLVEQFDSHDATIKNDLELINTTWRLNSAGNLTDLSFSGDQSIKGNGTIVLGDHASLNNRILSSNAVLTLEAGSTIKGAGQLLADTGSMDNKGAIRAQGANKLVINTQNGGTFENNGILAAEGTGGLHITGTTVVDNNTAIDVSASSKLLIDSSSTINGGEINGAAGALIDLRGITVDGVTFNGDVTQNDAFDTTIKNDLTLNGVWTLGSLGNLTDLIFSGAQSIKGGATIVLSDHVNNNNRILSANSILTLEAGNTIKGAGQLLADTGSMDNKGAILAQGDRKLVINTQNGGTFENNGILAAEGTGGLHITGTTVVDNNTAIDVSASSKLLIDSSSTINGGEINGAAGALIDLRWITVDGVTFNGDVTQNDAFDTTIKNDLTLNGVWTLGSLGNLTDLIFSGAQSIKGGATIVLSDHVNNNNRILSANSILTLEAGNTIKGAGQLLADTGSMDNKGAIRAQGVRKLVINTQNGGTFENNGILAAEGTGGLHITGTTVVDNNTAIDVSASSKLLIDSSSTINGGEINGAAGALIDLRGITVDGVTFNGDVTQNDAFDTTIKNDLNINGTWSVNSVGNLTDLIFSGEQKITGGGTIALSDHVNNRILSANETLTLATGTTVRGAGQILANTGGMINEGSIIANGASAALTIDPNALGFENRGAVSASGNGGLNVIGDFRQTAGSTTVNSIMRITGSGELQLEGGTLGGDGTIVGNVNNTGGVVNTGNSPGELNIDGDYDQTGGGTLLIEIADANPGGFDVLTISGTANLDGVLDVELLGNPSFSVGQTFDVLIAGAILGAFANDTVDAGLAIFDVTIIDGISEDIVRLTATSVSAVPLPAAVWLLGGAFVMLIRRRRQV